ncbi:MULTISPECIES: hypothetical protein [unclassified Moorena]|uniref:hypothetical protein n=1 Tax=unclassified Moorena TaxID=2683338 RepID=UPI0013BDD572|nr:MULTISPECIES: hypothetical protein [unclassified Moorena]NEQ13245.1 hypothetical protein [Moorena sp. SIO3E2]NEP35970.1 hypothetical protein [Moorena sp. SIO3B2]NEP70043.1 hypothetical protein [Moorena sp. SIO3A5]NEQ11022.1 hypothetical protein [Moorena sp. SIO4E2]NER92209.1 hypothetical protein [Moorena sp. SIO3A2]
MADQLFTNLADFGSLPLPTLRLISRLPTPDSRLPIPDSRLPIPDSRSPPGRG